MRKRTRRGREGRHSKVRALPQSAAPLAFCRAGLNTRLSPARSGCLGVTRDDMKRIPVAFASAVGLALALVAWASGSARGQDQDVIPYAQDKPPGPPLSPSEA